MFKAKIRSLEWMVKNQNKGNGIWMEMLKQAGKTVTIVSLSDIGAKIEEDKGHNTWSPMYFENFPEIKPTASIRLGQKLQGERQVRVNMDGSVTVGCTTVNFDSLEKMYKASLKHQASVKKSLTKIKAKK